MGAPTPAPGWYPDPSGGPGRRYWDGSEWTDQRVDPRKTSNQITWIVVGLAVLMFGGCVALRMTSSSRDGVSPMDKDGTYYHLDDSAAGTYETSGSARTNGRPCNWMQLSADWSKDESITGLAGSMIDRGDVAVGQSARVTLQASQYFVSYGCHPWQKVS